MVKLSVRIFNFKSRWRENRVRKIVSQKKLYKIVMKSKTSVWITALQRINDPVIAEKILRSDIFQKRSPYGEPYFHFTTRLIGILDNDTVVQEMYVREIEHEINSIKADYKKRCNAIRDEMDFGATQRNLLNRMKSVVIAAESVSDPVQQMDFLLEIVKICETAPINVLGYKHLISRPHPTKEFGRELKERLQILSC